MLVYIAAYTKNICICECYGISFDRLQLVDTNSYNIAIITFLAGRFVLQDNSMDEKRKILDEIMPRAVLKAMSAEAEEAIPQNQRIDDLVVIRKFPFRIGRESRVRTVNGRLERTERPKMGDREPNNDLYLIDSGKLLNISREHLQIEKEAKGYMLLDRGSACGTKIDGIAVGGEDNGGKAELKDGDVFAIGTAATPFLYKFIVLEEK
jgi:hypothetical protein